MSASLLLREFFPEVPPEDDFPRKFRWLKSDWPELSWTVVDPAVEDEDVNPTPFTFVWCHGGRQKI